MPYDAKWTYDALRAQIEQLQTEHPDRAIMLYEIPSVGVSSGNRAALVSTSLLQSVSLHPNGTIRFNAVPGTREAGSAGFWNPASMRVDVSPVKRTDLLLPAPERVRFSEPEAE
ncbi:hypothetical protein FAZ95_37065 [Trinickia violacea]|uniref:Uncharacterized protein n=1 Tax=Trinickia violacea TaxID=2571746 RepID=A0A4P8J144_9BURK|nr:hypothetical protein [Trinickia violacea]QCP54506.1 hypothetical protein FAZ95_37065 [Trinickia violacea]